MGPRRLLRRVGASLVAAGMLVVAITALAGASTPAGARAALAPAQPAARATAYTITLAARVCPSYQDVMANRGRNNLQESLEDLGKDSVYQTGQPVDPAIEEPNSPNCRPLEGWRFTLGSSGKGPTVDHLSTVTDPGAPTVPTATVPLLDSAGDPTGDTIAGAVTVTLTPEQVGAAQNRQLWAQGGTASDPLLTEDFGDQYAFAALRCAVDNYNADNVEWDSYPTGYHHLFCYEYLVRPAPDPATIVVRKQLQGGTDGPGRFRYVGNISYADADDFFLTADAGVPDSATFVRAAEVPWDFTEQPLAGWTFVGVSCTPAAAAVITGARVVVTAAADQTVTCTYTNRRDPTGALQLDKTTLGAVGSFPFHVVRPPPDPPLDTTVTTTAQGVAVPVVASSGSTPGTYVATETLPDPTPAGSWELTSAQCNGVDVTESVVASGQQRTLQRTVGVGAQAICNMTNTFTPDGTITIRKTSRGAVGTFTYVVFDLLDPTNPKVIGQQQATTTSPGSPVTAAGDPLIHLPASDPDDPDSTSHPYAIFEIAPPDTPAGSWRLRAATCANGRSSAPRNGHVTFDLTTTNPNVTCDFTNTFVPTASVDLSKIVVDPDTLRTGSVSIHLTCKDGTDETLTAPAGETGPFELPSLVFRDPTECTARETATGAASGTDVATRIDLDDDGVSSVDGTSVEFLVRPGHHIGVTVTDTYSATTQSPAPTSSPSPIPTAQPGPDLSPSQSGGSLPDTGAPDGMSELGALGAGLVLAGLTLMAMATQGGRRRSRK